MNAHSRCSDGPDERSGPSTTLERPDVQQVRTMADDKFELTRRKALLSLGTIGVASATGAGAWARFTDTEKKKVFVEAGKIDLRFADKYDGNYVNGPVEVRLGPLGNNQKVKHCEWLKNAGNVGGDKLLFKIPSSSVESWENTLTDMEKKAGDTTDGKGYGELLKYLKVKGWVWCYVEKDDQWVCHSITDGSASMEDSPEATSDTMSGTNIVGGGIPWVPLTNILDKKLSMDFGPYQAPPGGKCKFCFKVKIAEDHLDRNNANDAMTDIVKANIHATLVQND